MSKVKSPLEKKKLACERDHFSASKYPWRKLRGHFNPRRLPMV